MEVRNSHALVDLRLIYDDIDPDSRPSVVRVPFVVAVWTCVEDCAALVGTT
jgi:hypothetical protein